MYNVVRYGNASTTSTQPFSNRENPETKPNKDLAAKTPKEETPNLVRSEKDPSAQ